jgi:protein-S-isoprenylcysteine O-methyltransferase Ste14
VPEARWRRDLLAAWAATAASLVAVSALSSVPIWPGTVAFLAGAALEMPRLREPPSAEPDDGFRQVAGMGCAFLLLFVLRASGADPLSIGLVPGVAASVAPLGLAMHLRHRARRDLRGAFRYALGAGADRPLATTGLYARLRHPAYLGAHLFVAAVPLAAGSASGIVASLVALPATLRRIRREESLLEAAHGDAFRRWKAATPSLWPRLRTDPPAASAPPSGRSPGG